VLPGFFIAIATGQKMKKQSGKSPEQRQEQALEWLGDYHNNKSAKWSKEVKMKAGYVCERSGVLDQELLDSHHKKPRSQFPERQYDLDNGECLSLLWHAFEHRHNLKWCNLILWRAVIILWRRYVGQIPKQIENSLLKSQKNYVNPNDKKTTQGLFSG